MLLNSCWPSPGVVRRNRHRDRLNIFQAAKTGPLASIFSMWRGVDDN
jgi:hypothetical protein